MSAGGVAAVSGLGLAEVLAGTGGSLAGEAAGTGAGGAGSGSGDRGGAAGAGTVFPGVSIDSRTLRPGELFFAIGGERFDGHDFVARAVAAGAGGAVVATAQVARVRDDLRAVCRVQSDTGRAERDGVRAGVGAVLIAVDDPRHALAHLAAAHRASLDLCVVGVTGSNGKTTTKEMLAAIFEAAAPGAVLRTEGNLNNHLGVPLTLLGLRRGQHRYAVVEMGMSARGEIAFLAGLARPGIGVITQVAPAHLEHLGTLEEIRLAKAELFAALPKGRKGGFAVYPTDDLRLAQLAIAQVAMSRHRSFGCDETAWVRIIEVQPLGATGSEVKLQAPGPDGILCFRLAFAGKHNVQNAAAAAAAALAAGVPGEAIVAGLAAARPAAGRSHLERVGGRLLIDDCYNANPGSMKAALDLLAGLKAQEEINAHQAGAPSRLRAIAVLGDMLELGPEGRRLHAEIGAHAMGEGCQRTDSEWWAGVDRLILVGKLAQAIGEGARAAGYPADRILETEDRATATMAAAAASRPGDLLLVKASHGMHLEAVVEGLRRHFAERPEEGRAHAAGETPAATPAATREETR